VGHGLNQEVVTFLLEFAKMSQDLSHTALEPLEPDLLWMQLPAAKIWGESEKGPTDYTRAKPDSKGFFQRISIKGFCRPRSTVETGKGCTDALLDHQTFEDFPGMSSTLARNRTASICSIPLAAANKNVIEVGRTQLKLLPEKRKAHLQQVRKPHSHIQKANELQKKLKGQNAVQLGRMLSSTSLAVLDDRTNVVPHVEWMPHPMINKSSKLLSPHQPRPIMSAA
jgi:hypothetical protein